MRTMLKVTIPVAAGNRAIQDGTIGKVMEKAMKDLKPEAVYFATDSCGDRQAMFFFDMKDTTQIPAIAEPFFMQLDARVTAQPVMNADDLKAGLSKLSK
jgi:hypothetical protein